LTRKGKKRGGGGVDDQRRCREEEKVETKVKAKQVERRREGGRDRGK